MTQTFTRPRPPKDTRPAHKAPPRRLPGWAAPAGAIATAMAVLTGHAALYGRWIVDDAGLTFAYARHIDEGHGPVAQPGAEPIEGYSNPLWLVIMLIGRRLGLFDRGTWFGVPDYVAYPKAVALVCCLGIFVAFYLTAREFSRHAPVMTLIAGIALAANPSFVNYAFSGLENSLYGLGIAVLALLLVRAHARGTQDRPRVAAAFGGVVLALILTRPDGAIFAIAYPALLVVFLDRSRLRAALRGLGWFALALGVPLALFLIWRHTTFGALLPNTALGKEQHVPDFKWLLRVGDLVRYAGWITVLVLALGTGLVLSRASAAVRAGLTILSGLLLIALFDYGALTWDWMGYYRFATPVWVTGALVAGVVAVESVRLVGLRGRLVLVPLTSLGVAVSASSAWAHAVNRSEKPVLSMCKVAEWRGHAFNTYADLLGVRRGAVALADLGGTLMTSRLAVVDLAGLADRTIARNWHDRRRAANLDYILDEVRPAFLRPHDRWDQDKAMEADPRFVRDYTWVVPGRDYVRRDVVPDQPTLDRVRSWAKAHDERMKRLYHHRAPLRSCGATLYPPAAG